MIDSQLLGTARFISWKDNRVMPMDKIPAVNLNPPIKRIFVKYPFTLKVVQPVATDFHRMTYQSY